jgi:hypothetical protein
MEKDLETNKDQDILIFQKIREINNLENLKEKAGSWEFFYNKKTDMLFFGKEFPKGSFYINLDEGLMLRVDADYRLHGFVIENARNYISNLKKTEPEMALMLSYFVTPRRATIKLVSSLLTAIVTHGFKDLMKIFDSKSLMTNKLIMKVCP